MQHPVKHIGIHIARNAEDVYRFVRTPQNLPLWAAGLSGSIAYVNGQWLADSPMGKVAIAFVPDNPYGVLDHAVTLPTGETMNNPMRVFPHQDGCEIVFSLLPRAGMEEGEFESDAHMIESDLRRLKALLEQ